MGLHTKPDGGGKAVVAGFYFERHMFIGINFVRLAECCQPPERYAAGSRSIRRYCKRYPARAKHNLQYQLFGRARRYECSQHCCGSVLGPLEL